MEDCVYFQPLQKKSSKIILSNYRRESVTNSVSRLHGKLIKARIDDIEEQNGFRAGQPCIDNIFTLIQHSEK